MIRDTIQADQHAAMKVGNKSRTAVLRLILAKIKDRDIALRVSGPPADDDAMIGDVLQKMAKQCHESIALYAQGGRPDRAAAEAEELKIIEEFLPAKMEESAARTVIAAIIAEVGAASPKDIGRVMALVKERHGTQIDMRQASDLVKAGVKAGVKAEVNG